MQPWDASHGTNADLRGEIVPFWVFELADGRLETIYAGSTFSGLGTLVDPLVGISAFDFEAMNRLSGCGLHSPIHWHSDSEQCVSAKPYYDAMWAGRNYCRTRLGNLTACGGLGDCRS